MFIGQSSQPPLALSSGFGRARAPLFLSGKKVTTLLQGTPEANPSHHLKDATFYIAKGVGLSQKIGALDGAKETKRTLMIFRGSLEIPRGNHGKCLEAFPRIPREAPWAGADLLYRLEEFLPLAEQEGHVGCLVLGKPSGTQQLLFHVLADFVQLR